MSLAQTEILIEGLTAEAAAAVLRSRLDELGGTRFSITVAPLGAVARHRTRLSWPTRVLIGLWAAVTVATLAMLVGGPVRAGGFQFVAVFIILPFYAGTAVYRAEVSLGDCGSSERAMLDMPGLAGSARVRVNGEAADHVLWPPHECDVTALAKPGINIVEIEVANTLRNLLGAHFNYGEDTRARISIASYAGVAGQRKQFKDYGLLAPPQIIISSGA